jgi:hypothetical protein
MSQPTPDTPAHEPGLGAVELLCERLGELGLPVGPDTAREILRAVLALEAPRMDAHVREALQISLDTIRIAAQSASGVLGSTAPVETRAPGRAPHEAVLDSAPVPRRARPTPAPTPRPNSGRRPAIRRSPDPDDGSDGEKRPVFRRPRR